MSKTVNGTEEQFEQMVASLYTAYVNICGKHDVEPIPYRLFKVRMKIWEW